MVSSKGSGDEATKSPLRLNQWRKGLEVSRGSKWLPALPA